MITLTGEYKLELSEELGQRDEHHAAAAAVLLPHLLHQRGAGADGGDADGYRSNEDVDAAGASAWLVGSIDGADLAGNVQSGVSHGVSRNASGARRVVHHQWKRGRDTGPVGADGGRGHGGDDVFHPVGVGVWFVTQRVAIRRRSQVSLFLFPYGQCD